MNAADAAGRQNFDAGEMCSDHRGGNSGRSIAAARQHHRQVAARDLGDPLCFSQMLKVIIVKTNADASIKDRDRRRYATFLTHRFFQLARDIEIARARQTMNDDRRFKRYDGPPTG